MPVPFGFGVGDFIAIASLANGIIKSLNEARGSAVQYTSLIELLRGLSDSISTITTFLGNSSTGAPLRIDDAFRNGICFHMECCRRLMSKFLLESKTYTDTLFNGQGSKAKIALKKLTWSMYRAEDAVKLEQRLQSHLDALHRYLTAFNIQIQAQSAEQANKKLEGLGRTLNELHTLVKISQENRPRVLGYPWECDTISHVRFEDALGRNVVLPQVLCRSAQSFQDTLKIMFANHPGNQSILRGNYEIVNAETGEVLFRPNSSRSGIHWRPKGPHHGWERLFLPGTKLAMYAIKRKMLSACRQSQVPTVPKGVFCPRCGWENFGAGYRKCQNCNNLFKYSVAEEYTQSARFPEDNQWPSLTVLRKMGSTNVPPFNAFFSAQSPELLANLASNESGLNGHQTEVENSHIKLFPVPESVDSSVVDPPNQTEDDENIFRRVHYVLEHLVPVNIKENTFEYSRLPLIQAAAQGDARWVQELLLSSDIEPDMRSFQGWTALQQACAAKEGQVEAIVKLLIKHGADVNAAPGHGYSMTALQASCEAGRKPVVELLLSQGADVNAPPTGDGHTALGIACRYGYAEIVQLLLEHGAEVNPNIKPLSGKSVLTSAVEEGNIEIVELLIKHGVETNDALALQTAIMDGRDDVARRLIELGADVNAAPAASHSWHGQRYTAIASASSLSMIEYLMANGADINGPVHEIEGATAVQCAAAFYSTNVLEELIRLGGDVNAPPAPIKGQTAVEAAAYWGRHGHVRLLVEKYGAVINTRRDANWTGLTALEAAAFRAAKLPVKRSEEPGSESAKLKSLSSVEFLLESGAEHTTSPLHMAAAWGNESLGELLLRKGANPNMPPNVRLSFSTIPAMLFGDDRDMGPTVFDTAQMNNRTEFLVFLENWCKTHSPHFLDTLSGTLKRMTIEEIT